MSKCAVCGLDNIGGAVCPRCRTDVRCVDCGHEALAWNGGTVGCGVCGTFWAPRLGWRSEPNGGLRALALAVGERS